MCRTELVELRGVADEMRRGGGRMMAVCVDSPKDSRKVVEQDKLNFSILSDESRNTLRAYHLVHPGAGPKNSDVAIPAHVLIDRDGRIGWRHIAKRIQDRPAPTDVLEAVRPHLAHS